MKYKQRTFDKQRKIVEEVMLGNSIAAVARKYGIPDTTVGSWLSNDEINPDKEYARARREKKAMGTEAKLKEPKDPIPAVIAVAAKTNPEELAKENSDLRRKNAYLEDEVAYLKKLYEVMLKEKSEDAPKKKDSRQ